MTEIREVDPHDIAMLAEIHAASFSSAAWSVEQIAGSLTLVTTHGWLGLQNEKPAGFILGQVVSHEVEILTFAVHPDFQSQGIGEKLLQKFIESSQAAGCIRVFLEVAVDNLVAGKLYEKLGFIKSGLRKAYYRRAAESVDAVLYERILAGQ